MRPPLAPLSFDFMLLYFRSIPFIRHLQLQCLSLSLEYIASQACPMERTTKKKCTLLNFLSRDSPFILSFIYSESES